MSKIVHVNKESYDVYIGRPSKWGNPYTHHSEKDTLAEYIVESRDEAINKYREYLVNNSELLTSLNELDGKTLGCWCVVDSNNPPLPYVCHGQVILEVLGQTKFKQIFKSRQ